MPIFDVFRNEPNVETYSEGDRVFSEGDRGDSMFAVIEGSVEIRRGDRVLERVEKGGVFGEMALIDHEPRSAAAFAVGTTRLVRIGERRFLTLVQQTPFFALQVMQVLTRRLRRDLMEP